MRWEARLRGLAAEKRRFVSVVTPNAPLVRIIWHPREITGRLGPDRPGLVLYSEQGILTVRD